LVPHHLQDRECDRRQLRDEVGVQVGVVGGDRRPRGHPQLGADEPVDEVRVRLDVETRANRTAPCGEAVADLGAHERHEEATRAHQVVSAALR
jgi:hypothetical protein